MHSQGMSGFAGYTLGRLSAQNDRIMENLATSFRNRFQPEPPRVDVNALLAENQMLRQQLAATRSGLTTLRKSYDELFAWAGKASALLREAGFIKG